MGAARRVSIRALAAGVLAGVLAVTAAGCGSPGADAGAGETGASTPPSAPAGGPPDAGPPWTVAPGHTGIRAGAGTVQLVGATAQGEALTYRAFRALQTNGANSKGHNDALLDAKTLRVLTPWPVHSANGGVAITRPEGEVALALAWPSSQGYSNLILDLPGPGTYDVHELAAEQTAATTSGRLAARPGHRLAGPAAQAVAESTRRLDELRALGEGSSARQVAAARAWDAAAVASREVAIDLGRSFDGVADGSPPWGFTLTDLRPGHPDVRSVADLAGATGRKAAVRMVFDLERGADTYADKVATAKRDGLIVVGQILDSVYMAKVDMDRWQARVAEFVQTLPDVAVWEIGNEVNGDWLGEGVADKVDYAARYVKEHSQARTMLTLLWELGESEPETSMFTWLEANLPPERRAAIDEVGLSVYPDVHPLGVSLDRVLTAVHREFPTQRVSITELGYRIAKNPNTWWSGSRDTDQARAKESEFYGLAIRGYPYSGGGPYWWHFTQEAPPDSPLWRTYRDLMTSAT